MNKMVKFKIPAEFIDTRVHLHPAELSYGYKEGWINAQTVISLCVTRLRSGQASKFEQQLATLLRDEEDQVSTILREDLPRRPGNDPVPVWSYLALAWLYENRASIDSVFDVVEMIYADFGYPEEFESFVRYMPAADGAEVGEAALLSRWSGYLDEQAERYRNRDA